MESKLTMVTCPICHETYKNPKYLTCLHTFCEKCLEGYIANISKVGEELNKLPATIFDKKPYIWTGDGFPCPVCRSHVPRPGSRSTAVSTTEWAKLFPLNQLVLSIMGYDVITDEKKVCGPCGKMHEDNKLAPHWCIDCSEALCSACAKHHRVLNATASHALVSIDELDGISCKTKHEEISKCHTHNGKNIEMYCVDHNQVACAECMTTQHKQCEDLITIDKVAGEIRNSFEAHKLLGKLKECTEEADCIVLDRRRNIDKLSTKQGDILSLIRQVKNDVCKVLDDLERLFIDDLAGTHGQEVGCLEDQIQRCHLLQKAIDSSRGILQAAIQHGTDTELFVVAHRMEKELRRYEHVLEHEEKHLRETDYSFEINYEIEHVLLALDEIGSTKVMKTPTTVSPFVNKNARLITRFDATTTMDGRCAELTGGTFLPDDRLMLVDNANEKLKLFTQAGDLLSELELSSAPWDITCIPGGIAAVSLPDEKKILTVSSTNDCITPIDQFATSGKCYGIAYSYAENNLVVACDTPCDGKATVRVVSLTGKEIRDLMLDENGDVLFTRPSYVATNPFNADVYVSDECNNTVTGVSMKGDFRFRYNEHQLKLPLGVAADNHGCVYVCGNGSGDINQLSRDGTRVRLLMDGLSHPRAISFDPYSEKFLVTSDGYLKSTVQTYCMY